MKLYIKIGFRRRCTGSRRPSELVKEQREPIRCDGVAGRAGRIHPEESVATEEQRDYFVNRYPLTLRGFYVKNRR